MVRGAIRQWFVGLPVFRAQILTMFALPNLTLPRMVSGAIPEWFCGNCDYEPIKNIIFVAL